MGFPDPIRVVGLADFNRSLRKLDADLPKALRQGLNTAAQVVVDYATPKIPRRSGRAARAIRVASTRTEVRVRAGGPRVPYWPWLDFGGKVGRDRSVERRFYTEGRYLYPALRERRTQIEAALSKALVSVAEQAGLDVT